ncbi:ribosome biogenesis protein [Candidatus Woesearchaeota archaeon]|nr:ribosome biogenesis protein [Candidatus Woesearchaeota archaeon]
MKTEILKCSKCNVYTLKKKCGSCASETISSKPGKWSPLDRYGHLRLLYKKKYIKG